MSKAGLFDAVVEAEPCPRAARRAALLGQLGRYDTKVVRAFEAFGQEKWEVLRYAAEALAKGEPVGMEDVVDADFWNAVRSLAAALEGAAVGNEGDTQSDLFVFKGHNLE